MPTKKSPTKRTLLNAASSGNVNKLRAGLEAGISPDSIDGNGCSVLSLACMAGNDEAVALLLEAGANVDIVDESGATALSACIYSGVPDRSAKVRIIHRLLDAGANPEIVDEEGETPLLIAAREARMDIRELDIVRSLIDRDVESRATLEEVESWFLDFDASGDLSEDERSAFLALRNLLREANGVSGDAAIPPGARLVDAIRKLDVAAIQARLSEGADPDDPKHAPLAAAAGLNEANLQEEAADIVRTLLKAGANPDLADDEGDRPLGRAALCCNRASVQALIDGGADVNLADSRGRTPLMVAASRGSLPCVEALLGAGADPNRECHGQTAIDFAKGALARFRNEAVIERLASLADGPPLWSKERGVITFETNEQIAMLALPAERAAALLAVHLGGTYAAYPHVGEATSIRPGAFVVYRLEGHAHSHIQALDGLLPIGENGFAAALSHETRSLTLEYSNSDTADECYFGVFDAGTRTDIVTRTGPHRARGNWRSVIDKRLKTHDALAPGFRFRLRNPDTFEGLDIDGGEVQVVTQSHS